MNKQLKFDAEDEEFFGSVGSFGVPKFDNAMYGGVPRGFLVVGFTSVGSGSELFAKQFTSPAEEPDNTILISTNESQLEIGRVFKKYGWPTDIAVRTLGEEYNARVLEKELQTLQRPASEHGIGLGVKKLILSRIPALQA